MVCATKREYTDLRRAKQAKSDSAVSHAACHVNGSFFVHRQTAHMLPLPGPCHNRTEKGETHLASMSVAREDQIHICQESGLVHADHVGIMGQEEAKHSGSGGILMMPVISRQGCKRRNKIWLPSFYVVYAAKKQRMFSAADKDRGVLKPANMRRQHAFYRAQAFHVLVISENGKEPVLRGQSADNRRQGLCASSYSPTILRPARPMRSKLIAQDKGHAGHSLLDKISREKHQLGVYAVGNVDSLLQVSQRSNWSVVKIRELNHAIVAKIPRQMRHMDIDMDHFKWPLKLSCDVILDAFHDFTATKIIRDKATLQQAEKMGPENGTSTSC